MTDCKCGKPRSIVVFDKCSVCAGDYITQLERELEEARRVIDIVQNWRAKERQELEEARAENDRLLKAAVEETNKWNDLLQRVLKDNKQAEAREAGLREALEEIARLKHATTSDCEFAVYLAKQALQTSAGDRPECTGTGLGLCDKENCESLQRAFKDRDYWQKRTLELQVEEVD
jgi:DNA repair exonuclease SbcCD ATPase subunit